MLIPDGYFQNFETFSISIIFLLSILNFIAFGSDEVFIGIK